MHRRMRRWLVRGLIALFVISVLRTVLISVLPLLRPARASARLKAMADETNRYLPAMIGTEMELTRVFGAEGMLTEELRLVHYTGTVEAFRRQVPAMRPQMIAMACGDGKVRNEFLAQGIGVRYHITAADRSHLATVQVLPSDCPR